MQGNDVGRLCVAGYVHTLQPRVLPIHVAVLQPAETLVQPVTTFQVSSVHSILEMITLLRLVACDRLSLGG